MTAHTHTAPMLHEGCPGCADLVTRWFHLGLIALGRPTRPATITEPRQARPAACPARTPGPTLLWPDCCWAASQHVPTSQCREKPTSPLGLCPHHHTEICGSAA